MNTLVKHRHRHSHRGFSLVELMIAISLGLLIVGAVIGIFLSGNRNYAQDERYARIQENGRFSVKTLLTDLGSADFWGGMISPETIAPLGAAVCGVALDGNNAVTLIDTATAAAIEAQFPCIVTAKENTSAIAIKRVQGQCFANDEVFANECTVGPPTSTYAGRVFLHTNGPIATLYTSDGSTSNGSATIAATYRDWEFIPRIYYIRRFAVTDGDGIPTLVRRVLQAGAMVDEVLVEGIENFRITPGTASGPDAPLPLKVHVLVRSLDRDVTYDANRVAAKTYQLGGTCFNTAGDDGCIALQTDDLLPQQYYRRVFSSTVAARNPGLLNQFR